MGKPFKHGDRVRYLDRSTRCIPFGSLGTVTQPEVGRLTQIQLEHIANGDSEYVTFDVIPGYRSDGAGWFLSVCQIELVGPGTAAQATAEKAACACPIKDLMSYGHNKGCPEKR